MHNQDPSATPLDEFINTEFLYQHAPCGYVSFDAHGEIIRINETFCQWLGMDRAAISEKNFTSLLNTAGAMYFQMVVNPMLHQHEMASEVNFKFGKDELQFDGLFNAVVHKNEHGEVVVINATVHKITNRKKYEQDLLLAKHEADQGKKRFEFLSNSIPNLIWTVMPSGEVDFINQRLKDYFQQDDLSWYSNFGGFPEDERARVMKAFDQSLKKGTTLDLEVTMINPEGKHEWFLFRMEPFVNDEGAIELWIGSATTIHKSKVEQLAKQSQLTLNLSTAEKTISENKGLFTKIAFNQSHMIRKPLANIMGLIPLLQGEKLSEEGHYVLKCMVDSVEELDYLVKEVVKQTEIT
ncbi:PAS domain S-box-containing protein [Pedobacter sp. CAN_A7]|uniref:PAS domain-containing protein n=1 Tax=Pedobacter sp. CAN_A7 TaxID=2787722 RepID=UPI0018C97723